jgi:hypothetical protein
MFTGEIIIKKKERNESAGRMNGFNYKVINSKNTGSQIPAPASSCLISSQTTSSPYRLTSSEKIQSLFPFT